MKCYGGKVFGRGGSLEAPGLGGLGSAGGRLRMLGKRRRAGAPQGEMLVNRALAKQTSEDMRGVPHGV